MKRVINLVLLIFIFSFGNAQNINSFINHVFHLPLADRQEAVDSIMGVLDPHGFPYIHYDTACFIYKGAANSVELAGGFTNWEWNSIIMYKINGTDFFYYYRTFEMNSRLAYKYILNGNDWIYDPLNPNTVIGGYGPDSELAMPDYVRPWEIEEIAGTPTGTQEQFTINSTNTASTYHGVVYLPYNYDKNRIKAYPVAYFQDGFTYIYAGNTDIVLDNLISNGVIDTIIAVFVKPNNRVEEYAGNLRYHYRKFFVEELIPYIDTNYNTIQSPSGRAVCGNSLGGNISALISYNHPEIFGNCGIQAGAFLPNNYEAYIMVANGPEMDIRWASVWGYYDYLNENLQDFKDVLISKNYDLHWLTQNEGHNMGLFIATIDELLSFFFPPGFSSILESRNRLVLALKMQPNPFTTSTTIEYELKEPEKVTLKIYDYLGVQVYQTQENQPQGKQQLKWNAEGYADGVYYYRLEVGDAVANGKMVKVR